MLRIASVMLVGVGVPFVVLQTIEALVMKIDFVTGERPPAAYGLLLVVVGLIGYRVDQLKRPEGN